MYVTVWKILMIVISFKNVRLLYVDVITYTNEEIKSVIMTSLYLTHLKLMSPYGCDIYFNFFRINSECDFFIASRVCTFLGNYSKKQEKKFMSYKEPSFGLDTYGETRNRYLTYLECGKPQPKRLPSNKNEHDYPDGLYLSEFEGTLTTYSHISVFVADNSLFIPKLFIINYATLIVFVQIQLTKPNVRLNLEDQGRVNFLDTYLMIKMYAETTCSSTFKGLKCWLDCSVTFKKHCECTTNDGIEDCEIVCEMGYSYSVVSYIYGDTRIQMKICDVIDRCAYNLNLCEKTCLPVGNDSFYCEDIFLNWNSQFSTIDNISSPVLYASEIIELTLNSSQVSTNFSSQHFRYTIEIDWDNFDRFSYGFFEKRTMDTIEITGFNKSEIYLVSKNIKHRLIFINVINIEINKTFYIFHPLLRVNMLRQDGGEIITTSLAVGERYSCNSTAFPNYPVIMTWTSDLFRYKNPFNTSQIVSPDTKFISGTIQCRVDFIVPERPEMNKIDRRKIQIQPYFRFYWTINGFIITKDDNITCIAKVYVNYTMYILPIDAPSNISLNYHTLVLTNLKGGYYSFICVVTFKFYKGLTRIVEFQLTKIPQELCWYLFPYTIGAISQCGHDGYFEDEYELIVIFHYPVSGVYIEHTRFIQIPYKPIEIYFHIHCSARHIHTRKIYVNLSFTGRIQRNVNNKYIKGGKCSPYPYIEVPDIEFSVENYAIMPHYLFYCTTPLHDDFIFLIPATFLLCQFLVFIMLSTQLFQLYGLYKFEVQHSINLVRLVLIRNKINNKLMIIAKTCIVDKSMAHPLALIYHFSKTNEKNITYINDFIEK